MADGRIAFVEEYLGRVSVLEDGSVRTLAHLGGAPNGLAVDGDGQIWVAQNGGVVGDWRSDRPVAPSIVRIDPGTGFAETVATTASGFELQAPNDLCVGPDGAIWFTDPGLYGPLPRTDHGRICRLADGREAEIVHQLGQVYPNGIATTVTGQVLWTESRTRRVVTSDGTSIRTIIELDEPAMPDGCTFLPDGTLAVASLGSRGIHLIRDLEGRTTADLWRFTPGCNATNCIVDGDSLIVTDVATTQHDGRLWRVPLGSRP